MNSLILILFFCLAFAASMFAQEARKIDEFGNTNCCDYGARIDGLFIELNKYSDAKGYVYVYEGNLEQGVYDKNGKYKGTKNVLSEKGLAKELIGYFKKHLLFRSYPSERIIFIEGGFRVKFTVELWFVPNGVNSPKPTPTLERIKQRKPKRKPFGFCGEM